MKPGKPTTFAVLEHKGKKKIVFGLPGTLSLSRVLIGIFMRFLYYRKSSFCHGFYLSLRYSRLSQAFWPQPPTSRRRQGEAKRQRWQRHPLGPEARVQESRARVGDGGGDRRRRGHQGTPDELQVYHHEPIFWSEIVAVKDVSIVCFFFRLMSCLSSNALLILPAKNKDKPEIKSGEVCEALIIGELRA